MTTAKASSAGGNNRKVSVFAREKPTPSPTKHVIKGNVRKTVNALTSADIHLMIRSSRKSDSALRIKSSTASLLIVYSRASNKTMIGRPMKLLVQR
jgi:type III secretory pathway lipoprotein EscJ